MIAIHFLNNIIVRSQNSNSSVLQPINIFRIIDHKDKANPAEGRRDSGILEGNQLEVGGAPVPIPNRDAQLTPHSKHSWLDTDHKSQGTEQVRLFCRLDLSQSLE